MLSQGQADVKTLAEEKASHLVKITFFRSSSERNFCHI